LRAIVLDNGFISTGNVSVEERGQKKTFVLTTLSDGVRNRTFPNTSYASQQKYLGCLIRVDRLDPGPELVEKCCPGILQADLFRIVGSAFNIRKPVQSFN
jgi:hypothetical protein